MATNLNALGIRRALQALDDDQSRQWRAPEEFGPDGWRFRAEDALTQVAEVIATVAETDGVEFIHASIVVILRMPSYEEMVLLHRAVFGDRRYSYQVFAPSEEHVNIHQGALHLWGRLDGEPWIPAIADIVREFGSI